MVILCLTSGGAAKLLDRVTEPLYSPSSAAGGVYISIPLPALIICLSGYSHSSECEVAFHCFSLYHPNAVSTISCAHGSFDVFEKWLFKSLPFKNSGHLSSISV